MGGGDIDINLPPVSPGAQMRMGGWEEDLVTGVRYMATLARRLSERPPA